MHTKLIVERLKDLQVEHHLTLEHAAQTGLSKAALGKYEGDENKDISPFSIVSDTGKVLQDIHRLPHRPDETKNHPDAELDALHLSDEMIALLKTGRSTTACCVR